MTSVLRLLLQEEKNFYAGVEKSKIWKEYQTETKKTKPLTSEAHDEILAKILTKPNIQGSSFHLRKNTQIVQTSTPT